jgi:hypothetical protein
MWWIPCESAPWGLEKQRAYFRPLCELPDRAPKVRMPVAAGDRSIVNDFCALMREVDHAARRGDHFDASPPLVSVHQRHATKLRLTPKQWHLNGRWRGEKCPSPNANEAFEVNEDLDTPMPVYKVARKIPIPKDRSEFASFYCAQAGPRDPFRAIEDECTIKGTTLDPNVALRFGVSEWARREWDGSHRVRFPFGVYESRLDCETVYKHGHFRCDLPNGELPGRPFREEKYTDHKSLNYVRTFTDHTVHFYELCCLRDPELDLSTYVVCPDCDSFIILKSHR